MGPQAHFANRSKCGLSRIARGLCFGVRAQAVGEPASSRFPAGSPASLSGGAGRRLRIGAPALFRQSQARLRRRHLRVQYDRHRSLVDELDRHARAEGAALHRNATAGKCFAELSVKGFCLFERRRLRKARPISLNWLTTSADPPQSSRLRSNLPSAPSKIRSRAVLPASRAATAGVSPRPMPRSTTRPGPISATVSPPTVTRASETRWQTARIAGSSQRNGAVSLPRATVLGTRARGPTREGVAPSTRCDRRYRRIANTSARQVCRLCAG